MARACLQTQKKDTHDGWKEVSCAIEEYGIIFR